MIEERDISFKPFECIGERGLKIHGVFHDVATLSPACVLFCHGFAGSHLGPAYLFVKISRALAVAGYSSLRFDFRGAGESEGLFRNMDTASMMEDLFSVTESLRQLHAPSRLVLLGHSFGGMVAARCAGQCDADGLILLSPVGDPEGIAKRREALVAAGPNADGNYENGPHEMSLSFLKHLKGYDPVEELCTSFKGPMLLMQGDADPSISTAESYRYVEQGRKASLDVEYHLLEHTDHNYYKVSDVNNVISTTVSWVKEHFGE
jgi:uncharacterized protein